jgi:hypothetical protein
MKWKLSREMTIILQPGRYRTAFRVPALDSPGQGGRPPAKIALMSKAIVPAAAYQIEAMKARSAPALTPTYLPAAG